MNINGHITVLVKRLNEEFQQLCFKEVILTEKSEVQVYANEEKSLSYLQTFNSFHFLLSFIKLY